MCHNTREGCVVTHPFHQDPDVAPVWTDFLPESHSTEQGPWTWSLVLTMMILM